MTRDANAKRFESQQRAYHAELGRLAELAFVTYCRNIYVPLYLAGTKRSGDGVWERLTVASEMDIDARDFLTPIYPEPIPKHLTQDQMRAWMQDRLGREPLSIFAD